MDIPLNSPESSRDMELEAICDSVTGRSIYTYLPRGTRLNGKVLKNASEQFDDSGDGLEKNQSTWDTTCKEASKFLNLTRPDDLGKILITKWNELEPNPDKKVIFAIRGLQQEAKTQHRGPIPYNLFTEMPEESAVRLISLIKEEPMLLEKFYQKVFTDLDSLPNEDTGLRRIKTDNLWIVDMSESYPLETAIKLKLPEKIGVRG